MIYLTSFEYIQLKVVRGDLAELNRFGRDGWKIVGTTNAYSDTVNVLLMRNVRENVTKTEAINCPIHITQSLTCACSNRHKLLSWISTLTSYGLTSGGGKLVSDYDLRRMVEKITGE